MYYNLIIGFNPDSQGPWSLDGSRLIEEYTEDDLVGMFKPDGLVANSVEKLPTLALEELEPSRSSLAHVGSVRLIRQRGRVGEFRFDRSPEIPPIPADLIRDRRSDIGIHDEFELHRTHWSVKRVDLFRLLFLDAVERPVVPTVVGVTALEPIRGDQVSVMMRFRADFDQVYESIAEAVSRAGMQCHRADQIDENPAVITDIAKLIMRSRVVIVDLTDLNPNVLYEYGLACGVGREVVLITQDGEAAFDFVHNRYIHYTNTADGRAELARKLSGRLARYGFG